MGQQPRQTDHPWIRKWLATAVAPFLFLACMPPSVEIADEDEDMDTVAAYRPAWLRDEERAAARALKADGWFPYRLTAPPSRPVSPPPEWDDLEGIFLRWPVGWPELKPTYLALTEAIQETASLHIVVSSQRALEEAWRDMERCVGCHPEDVFWLIAPTDSIWMRDYGPQFVRYDDGDLGVVNLSYFPNRTEDDLFPARFAPSMGLSLYSPGLYLEGGNFQTDGRGRCVVSNEAAEINGVAEANRLVEDYFGCEAVEFVSYLLEEGTRHIDMWLKFLDEETVIVGDYRYDGHRPLHYPDRINADILDEVATTLARLGYHVVRIPMPATYWSRETGAYTFRSYTNSVMVNGSLLMPIYDHQADILAYRIYQDLLPEGTRIVPIDTRYAIEFGGSLHCMTVENHRNKPLAN